MRSNERGTPPKREKSRSFSKGENQILRLFGVARVVTGEHSRRSWFGLFGRRDDGESASILVVRGGEIHCSPLLERRPRRPGGNTRCRIVHITHVRLHIIQPFAAAVVRDHGFVRIVGDRSDGLADLLGQGGPCHGRAHIVKGQGYSKPTCPSDPTQSVRILTIDDTCRRVPRRRPRYYYTWRNDSPRRWP